MTRRPDVGPLFGAAVVDNFPGAAQAPTISKGAASEDRGPLGVPCATCIRLVGPYCAGAPKAIRTLIAGYASNLHHVDFTSAGPIFRRAVTAVDGGDLASLVPDPAADRAAIRQAVATVLARGAIPIVIGGDDSAPIPVFQAFRCPLAVHHRPDRCPYRRREEVAGERSALSSTMRRASEMPHSSASSRSGSALSAQRDRATSPMRPRGLRSSPPAGGAMSTASRRLLDAVPAGSQVLVTLDGDGLDPTIMPGVLAPAPGGSHLLAGDRDPAWIRGQGPDRGFRPRRVHAGARLRAWERSRRRASSSMSWASWRARLLPFRSKPNSVRVPTRVSRPP